MVEVVVSAGVLVQLVCCWCAGSLYRVTVRLSGSEEALSHGGDVGRFAIKILGVKGSTHMMDLFRSVRPQWPSDSLEP